jgi:hypothetical protein
MCRNCKLFEKDAWLAKAILFPARCIGAGLPRSAAMRGSESPDSVSRLFSEKFSVPTQVPVPNRL